MKILLLNANRAERGTYYRALGFGRQLAERGHIVTMMTVSNSRRFTAEAREDPSGLRIIECPNWGDELLPWHASGILDIIRRVWEIFVGHYDVVYAFEYQPNISLPSLCMRPFRRFYLVSDWCDWHSGASYHFGGKKWAHEIDRRFEEFIRPRADLVTTINYVLRDRAIKIGVPESRTVVIREGVDTEFIAPMDRAACRKRLGLRSDSRLVVTIIDSKAGLEILARAIQLIGEKLSGPVSLVVIGNVGNDLRTQFAHRHDLEFVGRISDEDLPRFLASADALALPLEDNLINNGRWPHKLGDMLAAERPVVVGPGGEFPQLLKKHEGALVVSNDSESFANALLGILLSPPTYEPLARRGREFAERYLDWRVIGGQVEAALQKVTARHALGTA